MINKFTVIEDRPDEYMSKRGGMVKTQVLALMDASPTGRCVTVLEYTMSEEEKAKYAGKLADKVINLECRQFVPFGTAVRVRGHIVAVEGK